MAAPWPQPYLATAFPGPNKPSLAGAARPDTPQSASTLPTNMADWRHHRDHREQNDYAEDGDDDDEDDDRSASDDYDDASDSGDDDHARGAAGYDDYPPPSTPQGTMIFHHVLHHHHHRHQHHHHHQVFPSYTRTHHRPHNEERQVTDSDYGYGKGKYTSPSTNYLM